MGTGGPFLTLLICALTAEIRPVRERAISHAIRTLMAPASSQTQIMPKMT